MDLKSNLDLDSLKTLFSTYRDYLIPAAAILGSLLILLFIIFPQFGLVSQSQEQKTEEENRLSVLNKNIAHLDAIGNQELTDDFNTVVLALPVEKNFESVLQAINSVANASGVLVGDYQFQVGDITKPPKAGAGKFPSIEISLNITADVNAAISFMNEIYKSVPLAEIKGVNISGSSTTLNLVFFFKPLPQSSLDLSRELRSFTQKDKDLLLQISSYNNVQQVEIPVASRSPSPTP